MLYEVITNTDIYRNIYYFNGIDDIFQILIIHIFIVFFSLIAIVLSVESNDEHFQHNIYIHLRTSLLMLVPHYT